MSLLASRSANFILPERGICRPRVPLNGLVLNLPLWHPECKGATFNARPPNPIPCTATGTTWGNQGRTFDPTDDNIALGNTVPMSGPGAIQVWFNYAGTGSDVDRPIIWKRDDVNGTNYQLSIKQGDPNDGKFSYFDGATQQFSTYVVPSGQWLFLEAIRSAVNTIDFYASTLTSFASTPTYTFTLDWGAGTSANLYICHNPTVGNYGPAGTAGDVLAWTRVPSLDERQRTYLTTRWRYQ